MTAKHSPRSPAPQSAARTGASPFLAINFVLQRNLQFYDDAPSNRCAPRREGGGPYVIPRHIPGLRVLRALSSGRKLHLVVHGEGQAVIELGGLLPERHYHTGHAAQPYLRADCEGRGLLRLALDGRTALVIEPVV